MNLLDLAFTHLIQSYTVMTDYQDGYVVLRDTDDISAVRIYRPDSDECIVELEEFCNEHFSKVINNNSVGYYISEDFNYFKSKEWMDNILVVPLIHLEKGIGAIFLESKDKVKLDSDIEDMILNYSNQVAINISNIRYLEEITKTAQTDSLTGIFNRKYLLERVEEYQNKGEYLLPLSVLMLDIDNFKNINDTYGHQVGDEIIKEIVGRICSITDRIGEIGRYGGEEFLVFVPAQQNEYVNDIANNICNSISHKPFKVNSNIASEINVTISIGIMHRTDSKELLDELLGCADKALYTAKENGRNQVVVFEKSQLDN